MLLGARQSLWRGGRLSAKSYVQEGLILHLDGIENARYGVHLDTLNGWTNLVDRTQIALHGNYDVGKNFIDFSRKGYGIGRVTPPSSSITVEACSPLTFTPRANNYILQYKSSSGLLFRDYYAGDARSVIGCYDTVRVEPSPKNSTLSISTGLKKGEGLKVYVGGELSGTGTTTRDYWVNENIVVGDWFSKDGANLFTAPIHSLRIYNRALTPEEITHNYQIDKERFGI